MQAILRWRRLRRGAAMLAAYLACLALWLTISPFGFNPWDECVLGYGGVRTLAGQMVWIDFFGYAPGRYLLAALCYTVGGVSLMSLRIGLNALMAVMPLLAWLIARRLMPARWALLPALMIALAPSTYYFRFYPFVALLGGLSLCRLIEAPSTRQIEHGLVLTLCTLLENAAGGFLVLLTPLALWISAGPWMARPLDLVRGMARILGVSALAALPVLGLYAAQGKLTEAGLLSAYRYVVSGASLWVDYPRPWQSLLQLDLKATVEQSLFWVMALSLAGTALACILCTWRGRRERALLGTSYAAEPQVLVLCLLGLMNFLLPLYRAGFYNVLRAAPLPWILGAWLMAQLARPRHFLSLRLISALLPLYALILAFQLTTDPAYRNPATGGPPGASLQPHLVRLDDPRAGGIRVEPRHLALIDTVVGWIRRDTRERDFVFSVPLSPLFYFFGRRDNPTGHDYILPGYWRDQGQIDQTLDDLRRRPPKLFIYSDMPVDGWPERRFRFYSAPIYDFLLERYAWTDRTDYPVSRSLEVPFYNFRRLRSRWPEGLEAASRSLKPAHVTGQVESGQVEIAGQLVHGWRLGSGSGVEIELGGLGSHVFLMRAGSLGPGDAWARPWLRIRVLDAAQAQPQTHWLAPDPDQDGRLFPMASIRLAPRPGQTLRLRLEVIPRRLEQLSGRWLIGQPALLSENKAFYRPDEPVPAEPVEP